MTLVDEPAVRPSRWDTTVAPLLPLLPLVVIPAFALTGELRLRVSPAVGLSKDAAVFGLVVLALIAAWRRPDLTWRRLRVVAAPLACLAVLVGLYLADPGGAPAHGTTWLFGSRLLLSALALLVVGLLVEEPARWVRSVVVALAVLMPVEAAFSWLQQAAGPTRLVYQWGYAYGSQVRTTSSGGLRVSGTFEDPFQLAALAVVAIAVALFVARGRTAWIIGLSSVAVLAATSVRTSWLQVGLLLVVYAVWRGFAHQALVAGAVGLVGAVFVLATTTTSVRPGAPEEPLLLTLNGRSDAWANAVTGPGSFAYGNGVGARGIGSTRTSTAVASAPAYDPDAAPTAVFAGDTAFLDSAYAQVLSDVGLVGVLGLLGGFGGLLAGAVRRAWADAGNRAAWAAGGLLLVTMVDWVGRASLASFTTGYLTLFVVGLLLAAGSAPDRTVT